MAKQAKQLIRRSYTGTSNSYSPWADPKTVYSDGHLRSMEKVFYGESLNSDGRKSTPLYRETFNAGPGHVLVRDRASKIVAGEYVYTWNRSAQNVFPPGAIYDRSWIPGFRPYYNYDNRKSLYGFGASELASCNADILDRLGKASLDIGIILVEMKETVNWISQRSSQLITGMLAASRGELPKMGRVLGFNPKKLKNWNIFRKMGRNPAADTVSQLILETNLAIKPLINDIEDGIKLFRDPKHGIFYGTVKSGKFTQHNLSNYWAYRGRTYNENASDFTRVVIQYRINNPDLIAKKALGLATNPATAWEAVPHSWLIDYAVGVGEFLAHTVATQGLSFVSGTQSRRLDLSTRVTKNIEVPVTQSYNRSTCKYNGKFYNRRLVGSFPPPSLSFQFDDFTTTRAANVLALAQQLRR